MKRFEDFEKLRNQSNQLVLLEIEEKINSNPFRIFSLFKIEKIKEEEYSYFSFKYLKQQLSNRGYYLFVSEKFTVKQPYLKILLIRKIPLNRRGEK